MGDSVKQRFGRTKQPGSIVLALVVVSLLATSMGVMASASTARAKAPKIARAGLDFTLAATYTPQFAPWYYGRAKGYFLKEGINLTIEPATGSAQAMQSIGLGQYTCGVVDTGTASEYISAGLAAKVVALVSPVDDFGIISLKSSGITSPKQLIGKTIAMAPTSAAAQIYPAFLKAQHIASSEVTVQSVSLSAVVSLVAAGRVVAMGGNGYSQGVTLQEQTGKAFSILQYAKYGVPLTGNGIVCRDSFIKQNPRAVRHFLLAMIQSYDAAKKNPSAAAAAGAAANPAVSTTLAKETVELKAALNTIKPAVPGKPLGWSTKTMWAKSLKIMHEYLGVARTNPAIYFTNSYLP